MKLGKLPARFDKRTLQFKSIMKRILPPIPKEWDIDSQFSFQLPIPMFANDVHGDCVMAGTAHQTLRFEAIEQNQVINITDKDVLDQYFKESGGQDYGLVMLDHLQAWRNGWVVGSRKLLCLIIGGKRYGIDAFASIHPKEHNEVMAGIYLLTGLQVGLLLPLSAQDQVGKVWEVKDGPGSEPGSWGGHCVFVPSYNEQGPVCITWGAKQQMTWDFLDKTCDEAYVVVDAIDEWVENDSLDVEKLRGYLKEIGG